MSPTPRAFEESGAHVSVGEDVPLEATHGQARPDLRPTPIFLLYWQPGTGAYSMRRLSDGEPVLVPRIQILHGAPGVGGVDGGDGKDMDFSRPVAEIQRRGGIILDAPNMRRAKLPSYIKKHKLSRRDVKGNDTFAHLPPWRRPVRTTSGAWTILTDEDAKTRWEALLITTGVVPPPDDAALLDLIARRERRLQRHVNEVTRADQLAHKAEAEDHVAELQAIEAAGFVIDELDPSARYHLPEEVQLPEVQDV